MSIHICTYYEPTVSAGLLPYGTLPIETRDCEVFLLYHMSEQVICGKAVWWPQHQAPKRKAERTMHADQEIVVVCEHGGNLQSKTGAETGFQSQSLKAAYYLKKAGYTKVMHMKVL